MTRTQKTVRDEQSKQTISAEQAASAVSPGASMSGIAEPAPQGHASVRLAAGEDQPCHEAPSDDFNMAVRELAYFKWEAAGFPEGDGMGFWLEAELEMRARQHTAPPTST